VHTGEKVAILKKVLGSGYKSGDEYLFACPACDHHKKKLSINVAKDKFKCWICEYRGNSIRRVVRKYGDFKQLKEWDKYEKSVAHDLQSFQEIMNEKLFGKKPEPEQETRIPLPEEFKTLTSNKLPLTASPAMRFLSDRGVTKTDILRWKIGYCGTGEYEGRVVIPSFSMTGHINYFVGRTYNNDWRKYMSPPVSKDIVFNELYVDWDSDLAIVEGVFDAIVAGNAIPILGTTISERSKVFKEIIKHDTPVYLALDADAEKKSLILIKQLLEYGVELYKVNITPYSDVGEMSREEFNKRKEKAKLIDAEAYLSHSIGLIK